MHLQPMDRLKRLSLWAATAALIAEVGIKNLMMTTLITVGTPATATAFVYEVVQMRNARLDREAADRANLSVKSTGSLLDPLVADFTSVSTTDAGPGPQVTDLPHKIAAMLIEREQFVDLYGGNPETVTPTYQKIARIMLDEDDRVFAKLDAEKQANPFEYRDRFAAADAALRTLHVAVKMLTPKADRATTSEAARP